MADLLNLCVHSVVHVSCDIGYKIDSIDDYVAIRMSRVRVGVNTDQD